MPSSSKAKKKMLALLPPIEGNIYELGSGWGHLLFPLAKARPLTRIRAFEGSWLPWLASACVQKILRRPNLTIERKNFFNSTLCEADGVVCFLYSGAMLRLKKKFEDELKPGAFIVSNTFAIPGWIPERVVEVGDLWHSRIYLYRKKEEGKLWQCHSFCGLTTLCDG